LGENLTIANIDYGTICPG